MKKIKVSLFVKLICMMIIPLVILGSSLIVLGRNGIKNTVSDEVVRQLKSTLMDMENALDVFDEGEYSVRNDVLFKGKSDIAFMNDYIRTVKEDTDIDVSIYVWDTRYLTTITSENGDLALGTRADSGVCEAVLEQGENYISDHVPVNGKNFFGVYMPLKDNSQQVIGMLFAGSSVDYVNEIVSREAASMTRMSVIMIFIILAVSFFIIYRIAGKLKNSIYYVLSLSEGDFEFQVAEKDCGRRDEIGGLVLAIRNLRDILRDMVSGIVSSADSLYMGSEDLKVMNGNYMEAADQITKVIEELRESIVSMAENIQICNGITEDMGNQIDQIVDDMGALKGTTLLTDQTACSSTEKIELLKKMNDVTVKASENIEAHIYLTDESVRKISGATAVLGEITSRINLLSLNAGIEAARAGEAGKGFAVVADEIRKLAKQSKDSTEEIMDITETLLQASFCTTKDAKDMREAVLQENTVLNETGEAFLRMTDNIAAVEKLVMDSLEKTEKMRGLKNKVIDNMCDLSTISEENAAIAENVNDECQKISKESEGLTDKSGSIKMLALELEEKLGFFRCNGNCTV